MDPKTERLSGRNAVDRSMDPVVEPLSSRGFTQADTTGDSDVLVSNLPLFVVVRYWQIEVRWSRPRKTDLPVLLWGQTEKVKRVYNNVFFDLIPSCVIWKRWDGFVPYFAVVDSRQEFLKRYFAQPVFSCDGISGVDPARFSF